MGVALGFMRRAGAACLSKAVAMVSGARCPLPVGPSRKTGVCCRQIGNCVHNQISETRRKQLTLGENRGSIQSSDVSRCFCTVPIGLPCSCCISANDHPLLRVWVSTRSVRPMVRTRPPDLLGICWTLVAQQTIQYYPPPACVQEVVAQTLGSRWALACERSMTDHTTLAHGGPPCTTPGGRLPHAGRFDTAR